MMYFSIKLFRNMLPILFLTVFYIMANAQTRFQHRVIDESPLKTIWAKGTGDFNNDGKTDIVTAGIGTVIWYQNPDSASGKWKKHIIHSGPNEGLEGCTTGDIDNDGDIDIIVGGHYTHIVYCLENPGSEKKEWTIHNIGGPMTDASYLVDLDGDGKLELVTRASELWSGGVGMDVYVWRQKGNPFQPADWSRTRKRIGTGEHCNIGDVDQDGKIDIIYANKWLKNDGGTNVGKWEEHTFSESWNHDRTYPFVADMNNDGRNDIVLTPTERNNQTYKTAWYEAPEDRINGYWNEHIIEDNIQCVTHALGVYDFDKNGWLDVMTAEMEQSEDPDEVRVYFNNGGGTSWRKEVLSNTGSHWCQFLDVEGDGDMDIFGANHGIYVQPKAELWENMTDKSASPGSFHYIELDNSRELPRPFGLATGDVTGDGLEDIAAGKYFYRNPGGDMTGKWERALFPGNPDIDVMIITNVDNDEYGDVIGEWLPGVYWLEAENRQGTSWTIRAKIGEIPIGPHGNTAQGYVTAQIVPGGKPEIILSSKGVYYFEIPENPEKRNWVRKRIIESSNSEEGIGIGDIDRDGDIDICGCINKSVRPNAVGWYENPGDGSEDWTFHQIGILAYAADRHYIADINGDNRPDIAVSTANGKEDGVYWFEAPENPASVNWKKHIVSLQPFCNSMDVADMDNDGDADIILGQHRDKKRLQIFENDGSGKFIQHIIDSGKESHLGARVADLDGDGDYEIISICYDGYQYLHLWRNDK